MSICNNYVYHKERDFCNFFCIEIKIKEETSLSGIFFFFSYFYSLLNNDFIKKILLYDIYIYLYFYFILSSRNPS